jgi:hypothetical protein
MVIWPTLTLIGFLVLTGLVIAMGTRSTARYEAEQRAAAARPNRVRQPAPDPAARATATATALL